jgi:cytochrome c551/c552
MWRDGKLLATAKDGRAHLDAYLDDHAYLLAALIEVMQADFAARDLAWAREIADVLLDEFRDDGERRLLLHLARPRAAHPPAEAGPDNATPSGNAVAALSLNRLSFLTGEPRYAEAARGTLSLFWPSIERQAAAFGTMLAALEEQVTPPRTIIVTGPRGRDLAVARAPRPRVPAHVHRALRRLDRGPAGGDREAGRRAGQRVCVRGRYVPGAHRRRRQIARNAAIAQNARLPTRLPAPEPLMTKTLIALAALGIAALPAAANEELAKKSACTACHAVDKKIVGPSFKDVAAKYRTDKGAEAKLVEKVKKGGVGVWGQVPMPPNSPQVKDADIQTLVKWILSLK